MDYKKEIEKLCEIMESGIKESVVRVFDTKTKKISHHTLGLKEGWGRGNIVWDLYFHYDDKRIIEAQNEHFLSEALNKIRKELEKEGKLVIVRGADRDCAASGMQADMSAGSTVSKLEMTDRLNRGENINRSEYIFHVLADSSIENICTLAEQKEFFEKWLAKYAGADQSGPAQNEKSVWKFELKKERIQEINMPVSSKILSVGVIAEITFLWVEVLKTNQLRTEKIKVLTIPTGESYSENTAFLGTVFFQNGKFVQHIFRIIEQAKIEETENWN